MLLFAGHSEPEGASKGGAAATEESPVRLQLSGGTDADMAPPVGYQQHVLFPTLRKLWGLQIDDRVSYVAISWAFQGSA